MNPREHVTDVADGVMRVELDWTRQMCWWRTTARESVEERREERGGSRGREDGEHLTVESVGEKASVAGRLNEKAFGKDIRAHQLATRGENTHESISGLFFKRLIASLMTPLTSRASLEKPLDSKEHHLKILE